MLQPSVVVEEAWLHAANTDDSESDARLLPFRPNNKRQQQSLISYDPAIVCHLLHYFHLIFFYMNSYNIYSADAHRLYSLPHCQNFIRQPIRNGQDENPERVRAKMFALNTYSIKHM